MNKSILIYNAMKTTSENNPGVRSEWETGSLFRGIIKSQNKINSKFFVTKNVLYDSVYTWVTRKNNLRQYFVDEFGKQPISMFNVIFDYCKELYDVLFERLKDGNIKNFNFLKKINKNYNNSLCDFYNIFNSYMVWLEYNESKIFDLKTYADASEIEYIYMEKLCNFFYIFHKMLLTASVLKEEFRYYEAVERKNKAEKISTLKIDSKNLQIFSNLLVSGNGYRSQNTVLGDEIACIVSDVGNERKNNEDAALVYSHPANPDFKILVISDGMGGMACGEVYSEEVCKRIRDWFSKISLNNYSDIAALSSEVRKGFNTINNEISNLSLNNGGATASVAILCEDKVLIVNIGDSRIYGYDQSTKTLKLLTRDESFVWNDNESLDDMRFNKQSNIIFNHFSSSQFHINYMSSFDRKKYDRLILCTDGVSDLMTLGKMQEIVSRKIDCMECEHKMIKEKFWKI